MANKALAYLLTGSNLGDREKLLSKAVDALKEAGEIHSASAVYETAAWGKSDQPSFLNQVVVLSTALDPLGLLRVCQIIEKRLSPVKKERWGSRHLDIDILLVGETVYEDDNLTVPHRWLVQRRFALVPLAEVAGEVIHPLAKKTVAELLESCPDELEVRIFEPTVKKSK